MKVSNLIKSLEQLKAEYGDLEIVVAGDPAGNTYGDLGKTALEIDLLDDKTAAVFPVRRIWADELE